MDRPLDFLVVSDHAAYMGILPMVRAEDPEVLKTEWGAFLSKGIKGGPDAAYAAAIKFITEAFVDGGVPEQRMGYREGDLRLVRAPLDFLGVNVQTRTHVTAAPANPADTNDQVLRRVRALVEAPPSAGAG